MFRILIADDNPLIRMGLKNMINWERFHAELAGEAENGEEALELIEKEKPDMVITDIRMPGRDGIYLLNQIREKYEDISTVVISAYDDFNYAREAIRAGSIDYILKPIKPGELNDTIAKGLEKRRERKDNLPVFHRKEETFRLFVLKTHKEYKEADIEQVLSGFEDIEVGNRQGLFLITAPDTERINYGIRERLKEWIEEPFLLGGRKVRPHESFKEAFEKAVTDAAAQVLCKEHMEYPGFSGDCWDEELMGLYCSAGDSAKVKAMFHGIIGECLDNTPDRFWDEIQRFLQLLLTFDKVEFDKIREVMEGVRQQTTTLYFLTIDEVVGTVDGVIEEVCNESGRISGSKKELILRVKDMIEQNYQSDISLSMIAQLFYVSPAYLSRLFKQETGENLNHYITAVRMKRARSYLINTEKKVVEVANLVGYSDVVYFTKTYKKYFGFAPNSNRQNGDR